MSRKQQVNFRLDTELLEALKQQAEAEGISYTDLIQRFCRQGLNGFAIHPTIQTATQSTIQSKHNTIQPAIQHSDSIAETVKQVLYSADIQKVLEECVAKQLKPIHKEHSELLGE